MKVDAHCCTKRAWGQELIGTKVPGFAGLRETTLVTDAVLADFGLPSVHKLPTKPDPRMPLAA